jgi:hypothetical protein
MKKLILTILGVAASFAAFGQGTIVIASNAGATIYPVLLPDGVTKATGANYSVEVFVNNTDAANKIGDTMILAANGRFSQSGSKNVPGVAPGAIANLIARAWDNTTGATYDLATVKGITSPFKSAALGGDVDGDPSTPPATAPGMVTGKADGFQNILLQGGAVVIPEPSTIALGALGAAALLLRRRK